MQTKRVRRARGSDLGDVVVGKARGSDEVEGPFTGDQQALVVLIKESLEATRKRLGGNLPDSAAILHKIRKERS